MGLHTLMVPLRRPAAMRSLSSLHARDITASSQIMYSSCYTMRREDENNGKGNTKER